MKVKVEFIAKYTNGEMEGIADLDTTTGIVDNVTSLSHIEENFGSYKYSEIIYGGASYYLIDIDQTEYTMATTYQIEKSDFLLFKQNYS